MRTLSRQDYRLFSFQRDGHKRGPARMHTKAEGGVFHGSLHGRRWEMRA
jgi:hypothetical protein